MAVDRFSGGGDGTGDGTTPQADYQASTIQPPPAAPAFAAADPSQSPAYLAFMRSAGFNDAQINANSARQKSQLQAQLEAQRPVWAQTLQQGLSGVLNNAAGRGTVRSSNRLQGQNQVQQNVNKAQAAYEGNIANQLGNIDAQTQASLLDLQRQRAEQQLAAQQNVYQSNLGDYQNSLTNYYLSQLTGQ